MEDIGNYKRNCIFSALKEWDILANENDFMEVCEWKNREGYDITVNERIFSLTHGQLRLLTTLTNLLDK